MKAVVFDWDLTLWNSWDIHLWLMRQTADALGVPRPEVAAVAQEFSRPFAQHLAWFFGDDHGKVIDTYVGLYREAVSRMAHLFPGIEETLQALKSQGYRLAVFSDKGHAFGVSELAQTGIGALLDYTLFLIDGRPYKPDPHGLLQVVEALAVTPEETLYIGDSRYDVECAHRAGARSGAALWASVHPEAVLAQWPHYCWHRVEDVLHSLVGGPHR